MAAPYAAPVDERSVLVVVDMQNDFVTGPLGTPEAQAIVDSVAEMVRGFPGDVLYTRDTHDAGYLDTQEGRNLPVVHCIEGTDGWQVAEPVRAALDARGAHGYDKPAFGSLDLARGLAARHAENPVSAVVLVGVCTDICVVSNALLVKAHLPEVPLLVDARRCAGVTPEAHDAALATMASCQIEIVR